MIIPVVAGAILGLAFDMNSMRPGSKYIFDPPDIEKNVQTIPRTFTESRYRFIESSSDGSSFLGVDGELSLKVKQGMVDISGAGKYMTKTVDRKKTVEMLITVNHETKTLTFPSHTTMRSDWQSKPQSSIGTHYIRSITYGGQLIISYKLIANKSEDIEEIKAAVTGNLAISGKMDINVTGKMDKINKDLHGKYTVSISVSATAGVFSPPKNIADCLKLCKEYPGMVKKINNGRGAPLKIELVALSTLNTDYKAYLKNYGMEATFMKATNMFEDLRNAGTEFKRWDRNKLWNPQQQDMVNKFRSKHKTAELSMASAISSMNSAKGVAPNHFDQAFNDYGQGRENIPWRYSLELTKLMHKVENIPYVWYPYTSAETHYIHWGSVNCSVPSSVPIYIGYAATSSKGYGNGGNILCLNVKPQFESREPYKKGEAEVSRISGMTYETLKTSTGFAYCALCELENATSVVTITGRTDCPSEMKLEYNGFLATNKKALSELVCMAGRPDDKIVDLHAKEDPKASKLVPVWMECEECEEEDEEEKAKYVNCAVCSR
ncbi:uncharacterized protein CDAR_85601 [Caerostris darwini]|uniref:Uncharacterized protein n=1 Tax=Caerostris darwini TaxID=1538125 RepID=A0AAV4QFH2_9ARAC|nr:uncharacterized protein CDAR_85601 [Caerostris darwini]